MSCKTTHHNACDCREEHFKKVEAELEALRVEHKIMADALNHITDMKCGPASSYADDVMMAIESTPDPEEKECT